MRDGLLLYQAGECLLLCLLIVAASENTHASK